MSSEAMCAGAVLKSDFNCKNKNPFGLSSTFQDLPLRCSTKQKQFCAFYNIFVSSAGPKHRKITIAVQLLTRIHRTESFPSAVIGVVHRPKGARCVFLCVGSSPIWRGIGL
jgi:hypothetical protein